MEQINQRVGAGILPRQSQPEGQQLAPAFSKPAHIQKRFPRLQKFVKDNDIQITRGEGDSFAEVFFAGEGESPDPSKNIIEVRDTGDFTPDAVATGDALHFLGGTNPATSKPFDKEFFQLKQRFLKRMSPEETQFAKRRFDAARQRGATGTNFATFENYMQTTYGDGLIRSAIMPELMKDPQEAADAKNGKHLTPTQRAIVKEMQRSLARKR